MPRGGEPQFTDHRDCQTLTGLTLEQLPRDGSLGRTRHYRKGANVWRPEDRANNVFFLRRGQIAVMICDADGHDVIVRMIEEGEPFGELCFCSAEESVRQTSARAVVESEAVEIKFKDFLGYLQENREALTALVFTFCVRLADAEQRVEMLAHRGAEERLGRLLLQLAASRGKSEAERKEELVLPVSHYDLAQMAAMSRPHVTVTMGRAYAMRNPKKLVGYDRYCWGITASDGPGPAVRRINGRTRRFYDYVARGIPYGPDDGTLAPWAVVASLPFAPEVVLPSLKKINEHHPEMTSKYGFKCSYNPTFTAGNRKQKGWVSKGYYGLDQGPIVMMIENYRSGLLWRLMRQCPYVINGLRRAGFRGGWLGDDRVTTSQETARA